MLTKKIFICIPVYRENYIGNLLPHTQDSIRYKAIIENAKNNIIMNYVNKTFPILNRSN